MGAGSGAEDAAVALLALAVGAGMADGIVEAIGGWAIAGAIPVLALGAMLVAGVGAAEGKADADTPGLAWGVEHAASVQKRAKDKGVNRMEGVIAKGGAKVQRWWQNFD